VLECVVNISEGRDARILDALTDAAGSSLLDRHADPDHHRAVFTMAGPHVEEATRALASAAVERIDLRAHGGVHPRLGVVDVVPFVPLGEDHAPAGAGAELGDALAARRRFAQWAGDELGVPCFLYGPERSLPEVRRQAFGSVRPDTGPDRPHPTAGACAVGARPALVAYNLWLDTSDVAKAKAVAAAVRGPELRALGLPVGAAAQVSCNLVDPFTLGPAEAYEAVARSAQRLGLSVVRAELVGLAPGAVVQAVPPSRRALLDLSMERTVEARLEVQARGGADGGGG
jgi:glutamate formiminotransferase